ncbi:trypsin-like peptidase domain-containing protein [Flagellimonas algicola]|uniref:Serine protease n=1 Tax=Flagellimonas algicola TaxID=2583815 RepID=A0ABY2WH57_9FLAO|nr:trypsin-like peptidase domain-containing protein [Allomuricauda algicola]TMU50686.1 hypothetical protein FGG15_17955 [Allomuricauda algicola]
MEKYIEPLCPDEKSFLKKTNVIEQSMFRKLVARRSRILNPKEDFKIADNEDDRREVEKMVLEKVNLERDFLPVSFLTDGAERSTAVCRLVVPVGSQRSLGTGFLVAPNLIITNNHVIEDEFQAEEATAEFLFEDGSTPIVVVMRPDQFFVTNKDLDYTIVACEGRDLREIPPIMLKRDPTLVSRHDRVNIIQHPRGRSKEIAIHDNRIQYIYDTVMHYTTDTEPGSSGSPVFDNEWNLVGLHHAGRNLGDGKAENEAIRIAAIVNDLDRRFSLGPTHNDDESWYQLMSSVDQRSPILGFFGNAGLGIGDLEVQVNGFQGVPEFADVGCWNIEHFNKHVSRSRIMDVADVLEQMSLDAIGLSEVEKPAMDRLITEINSRGFRYDYVLRDTRGSQDLAVLYDSDTTEVTRRKDIADRNTASLRARTSDNKTAFPRFPIFTQCKVKHGEDGVVEFIMIVVHLKAFGDEQSRRRRKLAAEKLAVIIEDIREHENLPVVLCGDFNEKLDNDVLNAVSDTPDLFALTADDAQTDAISYVGNRHRSLIDHIIVSRDLDLGDISDDDAAIVRLDRSISDFAQDISDHVPIVFRMILRKSERVDNREKPETLTIDIPKDAKKVAIDFISE